MLWKCPFLFQIKSVHSLDCDQESVWHVYHVCDCPQFHCSGFWRSCLREIWKEQIFGICRLWFHCHLYIGMLFKGQFSYPFIQSQVPTFQVFVLLDGGSGICASSWSFHEGLLELHGYHCGQLCSHLFLPYNCVSLLWFCTLKTEENEETSVRLQWYSDGSPMSLRWVSYESLMSL